MQITRPKIDGTKITRQRKDGKLNGLYENNWPKERTDRDLNKRHETNFSKNEELNGRHKNNLQMVEKLNGRHEDCSPKGLTAVK